jgi:HrpA-like RNA helicase
MEEGLRNFVSIGVNTHIPAGQQLARFPLEPQAACALVAATQMGCGEEALVVLAMLSAENVFCTPRDKQVTLCVNKSW